MVQDRSPEGAPSGDSEISSREGDSQVLMDETSEFEQQPVAEGVVEGDGGSEERNFLADLQRLQADFENYRKRSQREQSLAGTRAESRLVEKLLPVLDNFELVLAHGEGGSGVQLVFKELVETLRVLGLEAIDAEGQPFDPRLHEAVETTEDPTVTEEKVSKVHRRGYSFKGELLRPPMVVVAKPAGR
jgi:molecular chaperone GrpE